MQATDTAPVMTPVEIKFTVAPTDGVTLPPALKLEHHYIGNTDGAVRVAAGLFNWAVPENSAVEAFRYIDRVIPDDVMRGLWLHTFSYTKLEHVPLGTEAYLRLKREAQKGFAEDKWAGVVRALASVCSKAEWDAVNSAVVRRLNQLIARTMAVTPQAGAFEIEDINEDLQFLFSRNCTLPHAKHAQYVPTLNKVVNEVLSDFFLLDNVTQIGEKQTETRSGDFVHCDAIHYFKNGISKYDIGSLEAADKRKVIEDIAAHNTVLRMERSFAITNALPDITRVFAGAAGQLGVFDAIHQYLRHEHGGQFRNVDEILVLRQQVAAQQYLMAVQNNLTLDDQLYLTVIQRTLGWR